MTRAWAISPRGLAGRASGRLAAIACLLACVLVEAMEDAKGVKPGKSLGVFKGSTAPWRVGLAIGLALAMSVRGYRKGSLNWSGAVLASVVGFISCVASVRFGLTLIVFFLGSSKVTKIGADKKKKIEDGHKEGGQRNWVQVVANGGFGTLLALGYWGRWTSLGLPPEMPLDFGLRPVETWLQVAYVCHYAACNADTWASELGVLSRAEPWLITMPWRTVPAGTNGGVTWVGTGASAAGGLVIGLTFWLLGALMRPSPRLIPDAPPQWPLILLGGFAGVLGSAIDSVLGATLQYSGWCDERKVVVEDSTHPTAKRICGLDILDNHQVNFFAACFSSWVSTRAARVLLFNPVHFPASQSPSFAFE